MSSSTPFGKAPPPRPDRGGGSKLGVTDSPDKPVAPVSASTGRGRGSFTTAAEAAGRGRGNSGNDHNSAEVSPINPSPGRGSNIGRGRGEESTSGGRGSNIGSARGSSIGRGRAAPPPPNDNTSDTEMDFAAAAARGRGVAKRPPVRASHQVTTNSSSLAEEEGGEEKFSAAMARGKATGKRKSQHSSIQGLPSESEGEPAAIQAKPKSNTMTAGSNTEKRSSETDGLPPVLPKPPGLFSNSETSEQNPAPMLKRAYTTSEVTRAKSVNNADLNKFSAAPTAKPLPKPPVAQQQSATAVPQQPGSRLPRSSSVGSAAALTSPNPEIVVDDSDVFDDENHKPFNSNESNRTSLNNNKPPLPPKPDEFKGESKPELPPKPASKPSVPRRPTAKSDSISKPALPPKPSRPPPATRELSVYISSGEKGTDEEGEYSLFQKVLAEGALEEEADAFVQSQSSNASGNQSGDHKSQGKGVSLKLRKGGGTNKMKSWGKSFGKQVKGAGVAAARGTATAARTAAKASTKLANQAGEAYVNITKRDEEDEEADEDSNPNQGSNADSLEPPASEATRIFGVPLEDAVERGPEDSKMFFLPLLVLRCIQYLNETSVSEEGIFRLSGSTLQINRFKAAYDRGEDPDLSVCMDPNVIAGLLKLYLRELPESIFTERLVLEFEAVAEQDRAAEKLRSLLFQLPLSNQAVLEWLMILLTNVATVSDLNKMTPENLAIVFSPTLRGSGELVRRMILESEQIFARD